VLIISERLVATVGNSFAGLKAFRDSVNETKMNGIRSRSTFEFESNFEFFSLLFLVFLFVRISIFVLFIRNLLRWHFFSSFRQILWLKSNIGWRLDHFRISVFSSVFLYLKRLLSYFNPSLADVSVHPEVLNEGPLHISAQVSTKFSFFYVLIPQLIRTYSSAVSVLIWGSCQIHQLAGVIAVTVLRSPEFDVICGWRKSCRNRS